jgi:hypothetical protein
MDDLAVELWSALPPEIVERMLTFLSAPALCRFRTVCKRWNVLICKPEFGALYIQRTRQDAGFVVLRFITYSDEEEPFRVVNPGWSILDVSARRWYTINDGTEQDVFETGNVAMDHLALPFQLSQGSSEDYASASVSNPIVQRSRRLPSCPVNYGHVVPVVNMIVDNTAHSYKIFVLQKHDGDGDTGLEEFLINVYESTTNQWRNSTILQMPRLLGFAFHGLWFAFLNGLLYVLMFSSELATESEPNYRLWSYNHVEGTWKDTCVNVQYRPLDIVGLSVGDNQLFITSWVHRRHPQIDHPSYGWSYEISEVQLEDGTYRKVFEMTAALARQVFQVSFFYCASNLVSPYCVT